MKLRSATLVDVAAVAELEAAVFGADAWSEQAVRDELTGAGRCAVIVIDGSAVTGFAVLRVVGETAELHRIAVAPRRQRARVGSTLLDAVLSTAWARSCTEVLLEVRADNVAALALYERYGFAEVTRRRAYYADRADALVLKVRGPLTNACER